MNVVHFNSSWWSFIKANNFTSMKMDPSNYAKNSVIGESDSIYSGSGSLDHPLWHMIGLHVSRFLIIGPAIIGMILLCFWCSDKDVETMMIGKA